jgi:hypothetical protein
MDAAEVCQMNFYSGNIKLYISQCEQLPALGGYNLLSRA